MKNYMLRILVLVLGISFAAQVSGRSYHRYAVKEYSSVKITSAPIADLSAFGMNMPANSSFSGILLVEKTSAPNLALSATLRDGGDDEGDDTSDDNDTGDDHHHHDGDTTHDGGDHGDGDTSDVGDTTHDGGDHGGDHDENDTIDCDHHHGDHGDADDSDDNDDTTDVNDTAGRAMFGSGSESITIRTGHHVSDISLQFVNNLTTNVTISGVAFASGMNFRIVSGAPTSDHPAKLAPGARLMLTIRYTSPDKNRHNDDLVLTSNSSTSARKVTVGGQQIASSVSNALPAGVSISMTPNPMSSHLKISLAGARSAEVTIYDVNGKNLTTTNITSSEWLWDGTSSNGTVMLSGTYFVRLTGESTDGAAFNTMQKIILQR